MSNDEIRITLATMATQAAAGQCAASDELSGTAVEPGLLNAQQQVSLIVALSAMDYAREMLLRLAKAVLPEPAETTTTKPN